MSCMFLDGCTHGRQNVTTKDKSDDISSFKHLIKDKSGSASSFKIASSDNMSGFRLVKKDTEKEVMSLLYIKPKPYMSVEELKRNPRGWDDKGEFVTATISKNPPLTVLPMTLKQQQSMQIEKFPNGMRQQVKLAFKTCTQVLSNETTYVELCNFDYKNTWKTGRAIDADDTDRDFFVSTFFGGKLVNVMMHNVEDLHVAYSVAKKAYQMYPTPISIPSYNEVFKGLDSRAISKAMMEHDKKVYSVVKKLPPNYKAQIDKWALHNFKDPDSVKYRWDIAKPLKISNLKTEGKEVIEYCFLSNAKSPAGGYTGYNLHKAIFVDGVLSNVAINNEYWTDNMVNELCNPLNLN